MSFQTVSIEFCPTLNGRCPAISHPRCDLYRHDRTALHLRGFTLVELLATLAIIGVLVAIAVPAVQAVRESARRTQCLNKLHQLALASQNFISSSGHYPTAMWTVELLPLMESKEYLESVVQPDQEIQQLPLLKCPSDGLDPPTKTMAFTSYLGNSGIWWRRSTGFDGVVVIKLPASIDGRTSWVSESDVRDGTSNTALFSEALIFGPGRLRTVWTTPGPRYNENELEDLVAVCQSIPTDPEQAGWLGADMKGKAFVGTNGGTGPNGPGGGGNIAIGILLTLYNHAMTPQQPSCYNGTGVFGALSTATSGHGAVVNVAFCDGHTQSISSGIDQTAWRALGSRAGSD